MIVDPQYAGPLEQFVAEHPAACLSVAAAVVLALCLLVEWVTVRFNRPRR